MKILITERQIRLILQEAIDYKDAEEYLKTDRSENIEERLNNVYESLKSNPEFISSNRNGKRLYFEFKPELSEEQKTKMDVLISDLNVALSKINEKEKIKPKNKKTYTVDEDSFLRKMVKYSFVTEKGFEKNGIYKITSLLDEYGYNTLKKEIEVFLENISKKNLMVVISRAKYDLAGMSGNRVWEFQSCMRIPTRQNKKNKGAYCEKIINDIQEGTLIAYVIKSDDKNIENPIARMLIKPFEGKNTIFYKPEEKIYGQYDKTILYKYLVDLLKPVNKDSKEFSYKKNENVYNDDKVDLIYSNEKLAKFLSYENIENISKYAKNNILNDKEIIEIMNLDLLILILKRIPGDSRYNFFIQNIIPNELIMKKIKEFIEENFLNGYSLLRIFNDSEKYEIINELFKTKLDLFGQDIFRFLHALNDEYIYKLAEKNLLVNITKYVEILKIEYFYYFNGILGKIDNNNFKIKIITSAFENEELVTQYLTPSDFYSIIQYFIIDELKIYFIKKYILNNEDILKKIRKDNYYLDKINYLIPENERISNT